MKELTYHEWLRLLSRAVRWTGRYRAFCLRLKKSQALSGILLFVAVLGVNLLCDAQRGQLDPRTRLELGL